MYYRRLPGKSSVINRFIMVFCFRFFFFLGGHKREKNINDHKRWHGERTTSVSVELDH